VTSSEDWDEHTAAFRRDVGGRWRVYCDELHLELLRRWLPRPGPVVLKTDLFDESAGDGLLTELGGGHLALGVDISPAVVADACRRSPLARGIVGDLRRLPLRDRSVDAVVSNSSLDHFGERHDLVTAVRELHRVLRPGGRVVVTLDNLACPIIALRAVLPYRVLARLGILPYPAGATTTLRGLRRVLGEAGFVIEAETTLMHVPRVVAIPICARRDRSTAEGVSRTVGALLRWERLGRLPSRQITGHFVGVLARRR
jgi:SAM-dependent methyltransferase